MTRTPTKTSNQNELHRYRYNPANNSCFSCCLVWVEKEFQNENCADDKEGISPSAGHQITFDLWQSRHGQFTMATSRIEFRCKVSLISSKCGLNIKTGSDHNHFKNKCGNRVTMCPSVLRFSQWYRDQFLLGRYIAFFHHVCWEASRSWSFRPIFGGFPLVIIGFMNQLHK